MSQTFIDSDKLATMPELRYLLLEVMEPEKPMSWHDLSVLCKERSLNFALAFENTIRFLESVSVLQVDPDRLVSISTAEVNNIKNENALSIFLFQKLCDHLENENTLRSVFTNKVVPLHEESLTVHSLNLSKSYVFIKWFLLNLKIASPVKSFDELFISQSFKDILRSKLSKKAQRTEDTPLKKTQQKTTFYISYSQKDKDYMLKLKDHFSGLILNEVIESHDDNAILPGDDWDKRNREMLERSQVILFLISSNLLASEYINKIEMPLALERLSKGEVKIIPVLVRPCDFSSLPISKYQAVPVGGMAISEWPNEDQAFLNVVKQIKRIL